MAYTYDKEGNLIDDSFPARIRRVWGPGEDSIWARGNKVLKTFQERPLTGFEQNLNNMVFECLMSGLQNQNCRRNLLLAS